LQACSGVCFGAAGRFDGEFWTAASRLSRFLSLQLLPLQVNLSFEILTMADGLVSIVIDKTVIIAAAKIADTGLPVCCAFPVSEKIFVLI
jgi:hypothetical protein